MRFRRNRTAGLALFAAMGLGQSGCGDEAAKEDSGSDGGAESGGATGVGGTGVGTGGQVVGTGGAVVGTGGAVIGSGGAVVGSGGVLVGTGGVVVGTGGVIVGSGGVVVGAGGVIVGSGGVVVGSGGTGTGGDGTGGVAVGSGGVVVGSGGDVVGSGGDGTGGDVVGSGGAGTGGTAGAAGDTGTGGATSDICPFESSVTPSGSNWVNGDILEFNGNGGWCWYQDERVIVDAEAGKLIIGSVASGGSRDRHVEIVHWDIASQQGELHHLDTVGYTDDHDTAAVIKRPDGGYAAMWAGHNDDCNSYHSTYNGSSWATRSAFAWPSSGCPTSTNKTVTYANMWYLGDTLYSYVRSLETSPNYLYSTDHGESWQLGGRLTSTPLVGYVAGYYKYWGNNTDRIDFFATEAHPRDNDNSLYHGYIQDGAIHNSTGQVIDSDFTDQSAEQITSYTRVFATGTNINGVTLEHMWNADLVAYDDGTVAAIGTGRVTGTGSDDPDKRLLYFRFDGSQWRPTYLARAGTKLYDSEQDYTGLGALHPDNPHVIYISTPYDPRTDDGDFYGWREVWKGVTCDDGASFDWEPITANSTMHNMRPVVPKWDAAHTALLWLRGTYATAQSYDQAVVGLIEQE